MPKTQLIDRAGNGGSFGLAVAFYAAFFIFLIAGGAGPQQTVEETLANVAPANASACTGTAPFTGCEVSYTTSLSANSYNQDVWITLKQLRPTDLTTGRPALPNVDLRYELWYTLDVDTLDKDGKRTTVVNNVSHVAPMFCPRLPTGTTDARAFPCGSSVVFTQSFITAASYDITIRVFEPLAPFTDNGVSALDGTVAWIVTSGKVNEKFTSFQVRGRGMGRGRACAAELGAEGARSRGNCGMRSSTGRRRW